MGMKVFIAAIDGLEYNLVEKWDIGKFKQAKYGRHDVKVAVREGDPLYTPLIWASFLLGQPAYKYGFDMSYIQSRKAEYGYNPLLRLLFKARLRLLGSRRLGVREFLSRIGLFNSEAVRRTTHKIEVMPPDLVEKTFIHEARRRGYRVWYRNIPSLPGDKYAEYRAFLYKYFEADIRERLRMLDQLYRESESDLVDALKAVADGYDLIVYYTPLLDEAHHMLYRPGKPKLMVRLRRYYRLVEDQVGRIAEALGGDWVLLIVSDHGYDPSIHEHSDYGFWSFSRGLGYEPRTILDFRGIIEDLLYG